MRRISKFMSHCNIHQWLCHIATFIEVRVTWRQPSMVMPHYVWVWFGWIVVHHVWLWLGWLCLTMFDNVVNHGLIYLIGVDHVWQCGWPCLTMPTWNFHRLTHGAFGSITWHSLWHFTFGSTKYIKKLYLRNYVVIK